MILPRHDRIPWRHGAAAPSRTATLDLGVLAWRGENNEYPLWIGAKPPLYPSATMLILK